MTYFLIAIGIAMIFVGILFFAISHFAEKQERIDDDDGDDDHSENSELRHLTIIEINNTKTTIGE